MTRRYAEDTKVPVARSLDEIKGLLRKAGADTINVFESMEKSSIAFRIGSRFYRLTVPLKPGAPNAAQEERRAWRLVLLLVKGKLEAVKEGVTTVEREFLADMLMPDGQTVAEWTAEPLALAYQSGAMPDRLLLPGPSS